MKRAFLPSFITATFFCLILSAVLQAQDLGNPDTVRIGSASVNPFAKFAVPVYLYNDEDINSIILPLIINSYSGQARFDSVSYTGSRLAGTSVLDSRLVTRFATDTFTVDSVLLRFSLASGGALPAGDGKLCDIWLTASFGGQVWIDSAGESPLGQVQLTSDVYERFTPEFRSGLVDIACNYVVGDVRGGGRVTYDDWLGFVKSYYGCMNVPDPNYVASDMTSDHLVDMRDLRMLIKFLTGGTSLPACGVYSPARNNDPGLPDTIWIANDTLVVGTTDTVAIGVINDEQLSGIALGLEWYGTAVFDSHYSPSPGYLPTARVSNNILDNYECGYTVQGTLPDTTFIATYRPGYNDSNWIMPGRGAIYNAIIHPVSTGFASTRLVPFKLYNCPSMLVTDSGEAIFPPVVGQITVISPACGDANADRKVNVGDAVYLINYVFKAGPAPRTACAGNANGDSATNVGDAVYLINYVFKGGPAPVAGCCP